MTVFFDQGKIRETISRFLFISNLATGLFSLQTLKSGMMIFASPVDTSLIKARLQRLLMLHSGDNWTISQAREMMGASKRVIVFTGSFHGQQGLYALRSYTKTSIAYEPEQLALQLAVYNVAHAGGLETDTPIVSQQVQYYKGLLV